MKKTAVWLAAALLLAATQAHATGSPPAVQWTKTFAGWGSAIGRCVQQTSDGGYVTVGSTSSPDSTPRSAILLAKLSASGDSQWVKTFKGVGGMSGSSVVQTSDGGFVLAGSAAIDEWGGHWDAYLLKTDASGNELWRSRLEHTFGAGASAVVSLNDTAYTAVIKSVSDSAVILWRTDGGGTLRWSRKYPISYGGAMKDENLSLRRTSDGGYIIGTRTLLKVDSLGLQPSLKTFGSIMNANSVIQTSDGGYAATGAKLDYAGIYLLKTNANRDSVSMHTYLPSECSRGQWVEQTTDGGYIISGTTRPVSGDFDKVTVVRTQPGGSQDWTLTLSYGFGYCVRRTSDGGYVITGMSGGLFVTKLAAETRK
jgi:hypothetical protein